MKPTFVMFAFLLFLGCQNNTDKNDKDNKANADNKPNTENNDKKEYKQADEPEVYIAFREDKNGTVYLTDSDGDIDRLIVDLRPLGVEVELLEPKYWRDGQCRKMSARKCAAGDCVVGNCKLTEVGGWNVCRCQ